MMHKNQRGITLIELVISLGLISIIAVGLTSVFFVGSSEARRQFIDAKNQAEARKAIGTITKDVKNGKDVYVMGTNNDELVVNTNSGETHRYYIDIDTTVSPQEFHLYREDVVTGLRKIIADNITYLNFVGKRETEPALPEPPGGSDTGPEIIEMDVAVTNTNPSIKREYYTSVAIRNQRVRFSQPYIAFSSDNKIYSSVDGLRWKRHPDDGSFIIGNRLRDVIYNNQKFVAVGTGGSPFTRMRVSVDAKHWEPNWPFTTPVGLHSIAFGRRIDTNDEIYVVVGGKYAEEFPWVFEYGIIRTFDKDLSIHSRVNLDGIVLNQVIYQDKDQFFISIGDNMDLRLTSQPWIEDSWSDDKALIDVRSLSENPDSTDFHAITCQAKDTNDDIYVIVGNEEGSGGIICSCEGALTDISNWSSTDNTPNWVYTEDDGYVHIWQEQMGAWQPAWNSDGSFKHDILNNLVDVAFGSYLEYVFGGTKYEEKFVAVTQNGTVLVSASGVDIPSKIDLSDPANPINESGGISMIGRDWFVVQDSNLTGKTLNHVVWGFNEFVIAGDSVSAISKDGINWTTIKSGEEGYGDTAEALGLNLIELCATSIR